MSGYSGYLKNGACFVAGTLVATATGYVAIEKIRAGDLVWAWDEKTGDVALKPVVETYINETTELTHIFVDDKKLSIVWYSNFLIPQPLGFAQLECPLYGVHFSEKGNDLTNTLKIQRIPINLTLALAKVTTKTVKRTNPRCRIALQRGSLMR